MRFTPGPLKVYEEWEPVFALLPKWCIDVQQWVWLEPVYRTINSGLMDSHWEYRTTKP